MPPRQQYIVRGEEACQDEPQGGDARSLDAQPRMAEKLVSDIEGAMAAGQRQRKRKEGRKRKGQRKLVGQRRKRQKQVEGDARQRRQRGKVKDIVATVSPPRGTGGLAPCLKEAGQEDVEKHEDAAGTLTACKLAMSPSASTGSLNSLATGQEICLAIGASVRDLKNAGTLLAWLSVQAVECGHSGPWRWVRRVLYESWLNAAGQVGPKRAATFPVRRGETEAVFQALRKVGFEEASSEEFSNRWAEDAWLMLCLQSAGGLAGPLRPLAPGKWTKLGARGAEAAKKAVQRLVQCHCAPLQSFEKVGRDLEGAKLDYCGEEVGACEPLTLQQILPALPPMGHGGSIKLVELVSPATRKILESPENLLKASFDRPCPRIPGLAHFGAGEKFRVCESLVAHGICEWIPASQVVELEGTKILNGLFGVKKTATISTGANVLRVIMNLKATNSAMHQVRGAVEGLPAITAWQAAVLECNQSLHFYQSDISSAFYLFELPRVWLGYLAFAVSYPGHSVGMESSETHYLACRVLPMGMHSSVALMQEVSEEILWRAGLSKEAQVRRGQPVPQVLLQTACTALREDKYFWQVYLDNFMGGDRRVSGDPPLIGDQVHDSVEATWKSHGILSAEKKKIRNSQEVEELGALLQGELGVVGGSPHRFGKLVQATLWMLGQRFLKRKQVQVVAGRWVHVLQFRRPGMSFLDSCWRFINKGDQGEDLALKTKREFLNILGGIPMLHTSLMAVVHQSLWCSDASETGGAAGYSTQLTSQGRDFVLSSRLSNKTLGTAPVLVVGLFSGIGGTYRIYDILSIVPQGAIAVDIHAPANRVVSRQWPGVEILRDVRNISRETVQSWHRSFHTVKEVHLWGGFPCRDLSSARANRRNLAGSESSLFFEFLRVWGLIREVFPTEVDVKVAAENVASMDEEASAEISEWMGCHPFYLDSADAVPLRRPRLCWTTEEVEGVLQGVEVIPGRRWNTIRAPCQYPDTEQWITPGFVWPGEKTAKCFPTCMRAVWKEEPPYKPAGIHRADVDCQTRWAIAGYVYPRISFGKSSCFGEMNFGG